ncbi:copper amine oxidase N-terminal domain-containing protein [Paenibacillus sp. SAF-054]|uniref:copper amine oxidase N-terminal domain-containing protein n=1 Tax=unclassified Paenibacillus TaxID=185978 RepID=UPI003F80D5A4
MKRIIGCAALAGALIGLGLTWWNPGSALAEGGQLQINDIEGKDTYLMSDGSMWTIFQGIRVIHTPGRVDAISGDMYDGYGKTSDGRLVQWQMGDPRIIEGTSGAKQVSGSYWLKTDGTVWFQNKQIKELNQIQLLANEHRELAVLTSNGDLLLLDNNKQGNIFKKLGTVEQAAAVKSVTVHDGRVAILFESGKVVVYETANFDDNGRIIPVTVAEDAIQIIYATRYPTNALIVTRKDGTVWTTGTYKDRWKLKDQIPGLKDVMKTSLPADDIAEGFYAQHRDGSWDFYKEGDITPVGVPVVTDVSVSISNAEPYVGDSIQVDIQESYSNGAKMKVKASDAKIDVEKPYLLKLQPDHTLKASGVGKTQVTVTTSGVSKTVTVSTSLQNNLKYAKQVSGTIMVPAKSVIKALGGTLTVTGGWMEAQFGDITLSFKAGSKEGTVNGQSVTLKAVPAEDHGELYIPAALLSNALGASIRWDDKWKQAEIAFGDAKMTVVSSQTAGLIKTAMQGSLAKYIGKTYWINDFEGWERFSKITVADVLPNDQGEFILAFHTKAGKTLKSYPMKSSEAIQLFADRSALFHEDPYKKYPWPASVWSQVKAGKVSIGMTKEQVQLSWGSPAAKDVTTGGGKTIETWGYSNFNVISFVDGKVFLILV